MLMLCEHEKEKEDAREGGSAVLTEELPPNSTSERDGSTGNTLMRVVVLVFESQFGIALFSLA